METRLTRFVRRHLAEVLPDEHGGAQLLLRGLPGIRAVQPGHAVYSADWYHPIAAELPQPAPVTDSPDRHAQLAGRRTATEQACRARLARRPHLLARFDRLLQVTQRYATIREEQARDFTLAWPVLRTCARRLGQHLATTGGLNNAEDVFFCTRDEVTNGLADSADPIDPAILAERRRQWHRQRTLAAPLTLGTPARLIGDVIDRAAQRARGPRPTPAGAIVGHPASAGRATGPVRIVHGAEDFAAFRAGEVLVAKATAPAWTPLFAHAAAIVTDGGTLAAHASLIAREYGIPAVVATGNATTRLHPGQHVTVDGTAGTVTPHQRPAE
jgi:pyruvate,water dikinase